ncbi:MAG TPA: bacillithiol system redox-active protein YtxJ, partial [Pyrinomonadaceae bacterium]|nr:bacillithiol system redox-active protein YtxJ [Pyrinomonadaceae bacterium]
FTPLRDKGALEELFARSHEAPVVLFKHSNSCPISAAAHRSLKQLGAEVSIVVVQESRDISREVESRTGVRHESPQALVLRNGAVAWSASHFDITADAVKRAVENSEG